MQNQIIETSQAPAAIGTYSQGVKIGHLCFISGQIGLDPKSMALVSQDFALQCHQVFKNIRACVEAADAALNQIVKLTVYLQDFEHFPELNQIMSTYFQAPYPARAAVQVARLPKDALIEIDAIVAL